MTNNTTTARVASNYKNKRELAFELLDAKEEFSDINIMLDVIFFSIDTIRKEETSDVRPDTIAENPGSSVCPVLV